MKPYQTRALAELRVLGRRLDAAAKQGADASALDPLLADMRHLHVGIADHLAAELGLPLRRRARPAALLVRGRTVGPCPGVTGARAVAVRAARLTGAQASQYPKYASPSPASRISGPGR
ncbi:hypothetical protein ABH930_001768 [Kitasatospora sp. GAS204A]|uniref:hypothetical protein n=1 Tax=unclassified Kitasatospora TaxID=2633591 RepID=UPI002475FAC0|nr:hypothetical protein [Kitasatospora sp. GAS204B]MDH6117247.1 hypothetical protein [Kitasatospora sp. GAS204B]